MARSYSNNSEVRELTLNKIDYILKNPRVNAYTPQSLVEVVCALLSLSFDKREFERRMFNEYGGNRPWWLNEDLDYPTTVHRLQKLVETLREEYLY
jgi:hypothetical protein